MQTLNYKDLSRRWTLFYRITCALALLLTTIESVYIAGFGQLIEYAGFVLFMLLIVMHQSIAIRPSTLRRYLSLLSIFCACLLIQIARGIGFTDFKSSLAVGLMILSLPFVYVFMSKNKDSLATLFAWVVIFHAVMVFIQFLYWLLTHHYLDLLSLIGGGESRAISQKGVDVGGILVPRFTGLFSEPGTFSVAIMSLVGAVYAYRQRLTPSVCMGMVASLCTMSFYGIVLVGLFICVHFYRAKGSATTIAVSICIIGAIVLLFYKLGGYTAVVLRLGSDYSGFSFRAEMFAYMISSEGRILLGIPFAQIPTYFTTNDIGAWFAFWVNYGIAGFALVGAILWFAWAECRSFIGVSLVVMVLLTKLHFTYPVFWICILGVTAFSQRALPNGGDAGGGRVNEFGAAHA